jgi:glucose-6-phosphate isomerase
MVAIGPERFGEMLAGFHEMGEHFRAALFEANLPVLLGLLSVWYNDFLNARRWRSCRTATIWRSCRPASGN